MDTKNTKNTKNATGANTGEMLEMLDWRAIQVALAAPFTPEQIEWRVQGRGGKGERAQVVAYVDARDIQNRLDAVVGMGGWSFTWEPIVVEGGELRVAKGSLTIFGVTREDVGAASNYEPSKGAVSDALKRAAVGFGIGRHLYDLPAVWVTLDDKGRIPDGELAKLRAAVKRRIEQASAA